MDSKFARRNVAFSSSSNKNNSKLKEQKKDCTLSHLMIEDDENANEFHAHLNAAIMIHYNIPMQSEIEQSVENGLFLPENSEHSYDGLLRSFDLDHFNDFLGEEYLLLSCDGIDDAETIKQKFSSSYLMPSQSLTNLNSQSHSLNSNNGRSISRSSSPLHVRPSSPIPLEATYQLPYKRSFIPPSITISPSHSSQSISTANAIASSASIKHIQSSSDNEERRNSFYFIIKRPCISVLLGDEDNEMVKNDDDEEDCHVENENGNENDHRKHSKKWHPSSLISAKCQKPFGKSISSSNNNQNIITQSGPADRLEQQQSHPSPSSGHEKIFGSILDCHQHVDIMTQLYKCHNETEKMCRILRSMTFIVTNAWIQNIKEDVNRSLLSDDLTEFEKFSCLSVFLDPTNSTIYAQNNTLNESNEDCEEMGIGHFPSAGNISSGVGVVKRVWDESIDIISILTIVKLLPKLSEMSSSIDDWINPINMIGMESLIRDLSCVNVTNSDDSSQEAGKGIISHSAVIFRQCVVNVNTICTLSFFIDTVDKILSFVHLRDGNISGIEKLMNKTFAAQQNQFTTILSSFFNNVIMKRSVSKDCIERYLNLFDEDETALGKTTSEEQNVFFRNIVNVVSESVLWPIN